MLNWALTQQTEAENGEICGAVDVTGLAEPQPNQQNQSQRFCFPNLAEDKRVEGNQRRNARSSNMQEKMTGREKRCFFQIFTEAVPA